MRRGRRFVQRSLLGNKQRRHFVWFGCELALHVSCGEQAGELTQLELIDNVGCRQ